MKHYANAQGIHCPVNCPVCHYNGRVFPARFRRILLPAAGTIDRITNKSNHVIFLLDGAVHISQGCNSVYLKAGQCMFLPRNASPDIQATKGPMSYGSISPTALCLGDTTYWPE